MLFFSLPTRCRLRHRRHLAGRLRLPWKAFRGSGSTSRFTAQGALCLHTLSRITGSHARRDPLDHQIYGPCASSSSNKVHPSISRVSRTCYYRDCKSLQYQTFFCAGCCSSCSGCRNSKSPIFWQSLECWKYRLPGRHPRQINILRYMPRCLFWL